MKFNLIKYFRRNEDKISFYFIVCLFFPRLCAPEMINGLNYDYNSDYYRLGGVLYYIMFKKFPKPVKDKKKLTDLKINYNEAKNYSFSCIDFINKLMISDSTKRIGYNDIGELKNHDFFKNFEWDKLIKGKMKSPFAKKHRKISKSCKKVTMMKIKIISKSTLLKNNILKYIHLSHDNFNNKVVNKIYNSIKFENK